MSGNGDGSLSSLILAALQNMKGEMDKYQAIRLVERILRGHELATPDVEQAIERLWELVLTGE